MRPFRDVDATSASKQPKTSGQAGPAPRPALPPPWSMRMKFVTALGTSMAGIALLATVAWSAQDAGKPQNQNQPKPKQASTAQQTPPKKAAANPPAQNAAGDKPK